jgi:hypothetical protein
MADVQDVKIAVLERELAGLREQHKEHKEEIKTALDKVAGVFFDNLKEMRNDIRNIYEFINQSRGSIATLMLLASALGGVVVAVVSWALGRFLS